MNLPAKLFITLLFASVSAAHGLAQTEDITASDPAAAAKAQGNCSARCVS